MAGFSPPYSQPRSGRPSGHRPLFLVLVSLVCLTGFHACSRRHVERFSAERSYGEPRVPIVGRAWVVDADTIHIGRTRIRLEGIDAPETDQSCRDANGRAWLCGQAATRHLRERTRGQILTCRPRAFDRYGRVVATCSLPDGAELNAWLVRQGWALVSGFTRAYASEEAEAKAERRGIWAGSFVAPWEWRRQKSSDARRGFGAAP
jgi:endonuclease YncB( thermonuclease family)